MKIRRYDLKKQKEKRQEKEFVKGIKYHDRSRDTNALGELNPEELS